MSLGSLESESQEQEAEEAAIAIEIEIEIEQGIPQIGVDMFVKKKRKLLRFTDAYGNLVYKVNSNSKSARVLLDPSGNPLISIFRSHLDGSWQGFKGDGCDRQLLFTADQTLNTFNRIELNICLITQHDDSPNLAFALRGCVFWRCCTIYHHNSILAQTNLMYKLGFRNNFVPRDKFRLTLFPGFADYNFTAALILIFLDARKH